MNTSLTIREFPFAQQTLAALYLGNNMENNWPVVYQINNKNEIYIGETTNLSHRLNQHFHDSGKHPLRENGQVHVIID